MSAGTCETCERWKSIGHLTMIGECSVTGTRMIRVARETCDQHTPDLASQANRYLQAGAMPHEAAAALAGMKGGGQ